MAFGVALNNRFNLFIDEEDDADALVSKQQREIDAERSRNDSGKKPAKAKSVSQKAAPKSQPLASTIERLVPNLSGSKKAAPSGPSDMPQSRAARRDADRWTSLTSAVSQSNLRQDVPTRDRSDGGVVHRGQILGPVGQRGLSGKSRGSASAVSRDGFDRFGKREFERHSGSDKTGLKPVEKRSGAGAHNWGTVTDTLDTELKSVEEDVEMLDIRTASMDLSADASTPRDDAHQLTLDEWKALQQGSSTRPRQTAVNIRRPGEGCHMDPQWSGMQVLRKKSDDGDDGSAAARQMTENGEFDDAEEPTGKQKSIIPITITFTDSDAHDGCRGGGGRGRGNPSSNRSPIEPLSATAAAPDVSEFPVSAVPNVDSEQEFPTLS